MCTDAGGADYIPDMVETVRALEEKHPLFVSVSDIPCIDADIISTIYNAYRESGKDACSTWIPSKTVTSCRGGMTYRTKIRDIEACPTGLNILKGTGSQKFRTSSSWCSMIQGSPSTSIPGPTFRPQGNFF